MPSTTGIELGPDSCVLAGVRAGRLGPEVCTVAVVGPSAWPGQGSALARLLGSIRRAKKLSRTARVVAWRLPEGAHPEDPVARATLQPLVAAGFRVDALLSPTQALAHLARLYPPGGDGATAWLALNTSGAAIAIVRGIDVLFSRTFEWSFDQVLSDSRAELLQRYSLVAHLAPEVQHGMTSVEATHQVRVDRVVTCGNLPDLRSLTMPLIEELDIEVETLDSARGLRASVAAKMDRLTEIAPATRLAWAAATANSQRQAVGPLVRVAAAAVLLVGLGWLAYTVRPPVAAPGSPPGAGGRPAVAAPPVERAEALAPQQVRTSPGESIPGATPQGTSGSREQPEPESTALAPPAPVAGDAPSARVGPAPTPPAPVQSPAPTPLPPAPAPVQTLPPPAASALPAVTPALTPADRVAERQTAPRIAPLKEPLPVVDSILIDQARRLAVVGGTVVSVGDRVGSRSVARIEPAFVELREPSGLLVRVPIRWRQGVPRM